VLGVVPSEQANVPPAAAESASRASLSQTGSFPADSSGNLPPSDREQNKASEEAARAEREAEAVPAFLRDVPQEQTKTLRCGDCGAMNYPTEWYCERCGAELAGM
jgi:rubrerythrin